MERTELIDFLRENLTVNISHSREWDYGSEYVTTTVSLGVMNENGEYEEITNASDSFSVNNE